MANKFKTGQEVVCISNKFPWIKKHGGTGETAQTPKKGEAIIIDEMLGEFLRFDKYDTEESFNWWHYTRFSPIVEEQIAMEEMIAEALQVGIKTYKTI